MDEGFSDKDLELLAQSSTFMCVGERCMTIVKRINKDVLSFSGIVYCDECKSRGYVDGVWEHAEREEDIWGNALEDYNDDNGL